jgi:hypothetical protein
MPVKKRQASKHLSYLAYRLGCLPFVLHQGSNLRRAFHLGSDSKLFNLFKWANEEGLEAIRTFKTTIDPGTQCLADDAHVTMREWWQARMNERPPNSVPPEKATNVEGVPQVPTPTTSGRQNNAAAREAFDLATPPNDISIEEALFELVLMPDADWERRFGKVSTLCEAIPSREFAELGLAVGKAITGGLRLDEAGKTVKVDMAQVAAQLETRICLMAEDHACLAGLGRDLSDRQFQKSDCATGDLPERITRRIKGRGAPGLFSLISDVFCGFLTSSGVFYPDRYHLWVNDQALSLHFEIVERLRPCQQLSCSSKWITATAAAETAEKCFGLGLTLSQLSKTARKHRPPFRSQPQGHNKLLIELGSFLVYLWELRQRKDEEVPANPSEEDRKEVEARKLQERKRKEADRGA